VAYRMVSRTDRKLAAVLCMALFAIPGCSSEESRVQLFEIPVSDVERAVGFYQAVFEWGVSRPDSSYALLEARPVAIGLAQRDSVIAGGSIIVVGVADLEMILARVIENGGAVSTPVGPSWRGRRFTLADPDGNEMVVWSEGGDASASGG
jgi:predicted enzyme related to lactoylglutathione lyase